MMKGTVSANRPTGSAQNIKSKDKIPKYKKEYARDIVQVEDRANHDEGQ